MALSPLLDITEEDSEKPPTGPSDVPAPSETVTRTSSVSIGCFSFELTSETLIWLEDEAFLARSAAFSYGTPPAARENGKKIIYIEQGIFLKIG